MDHQLQMCLRRHTRFCPGRAPEHALGHQMSDLPEQQYYCSAGGAFTEISAGDEDKPDALRSPLVLVMAGSRIDIVTTASPLYT